MTSSQRAAALVVLIAILAAAAPVAPAPAAPRRVAFLIESWYPDSHADVIGTRLVQGYRVGTRTFSSPVAVASVYANAPRPNDQTSALAPRYGFRVATSVADALLADGASRLAVDGVVVATREDLPERGALPSPTPRLALMREVFTILDRTHAHVPIFIDKMLAANWQDSQAIVAEAARRQIPLMAGSVLPYVPLDRPLRAGRPEVAVVIASAPYWAFAFHAAELLQGYLEHRADQETGVRSIRAVDGMYATLPDRTRWGGRVFDALLASAATRRTSGVASSDAETRVLLIEYRDGTRSVLALVPQAFDDHEYLLGTQWPDGSITTGGVVLPAAPFDHFGYLVHALVGFFTTGRPCVPVTRALMTTGIVLFGQQSRQLGTAVSDPSLLLSYPAPAACP